MEYSFCADPVGWLVGLHLFQVWASSIFLPKCIVEMGGERQRDDFEIGFLLSFDLVVI